MSTNEFLDDILSIFYHKFIYYVPRKIILDGVIDSLKGEIDEDFFDVFTFIDNKLGSGNFDNENALEINTLLLEKKSFLQQNIFKLVEKGKELNEVEFLIILEKYYEHLSLFIFISEWLSVNLKKYHQKEIHLSIIGSFGIQKQFFVSHSKDLCNYFGSFLNLDLVFDFSKEQFVFHHIPNLISHYNKIEDCQEETKNIEQFEIITDKLQLEKNESQISQVDTKNIKKKRNLPHIDELELETMILKSVFNVNEN